MTGHSRLTTALEIQPDGLRSSVVTELRSQAPLLLRLTMPKAGESTHAAAPGAVHVCVAAGAAGPVGGDQLTLDIDVGAESTLVLADIAATLLLPGPHGGQSSTTVTIRVGNGATCVWLPEPIIAAHNCRHRHIVRVELDPGARLLMREELILGRHGEPPGTVHQHVRVRRGAATLYHQQLSIGPGAAGWDTPAVVGDHRAVGSVLVVDPDWADNPPPGGPLGDSIALMPLAGPAAVITALGADNLALRRGLNAGLSALEPVFSSVAPG